MKHIFKLLFFAFLGSCNYFEKDIVKKETKLNSIVIVENKKNTDTDLYFSLPNKLESHQDSITLITQIKNKLQIHLDSNFNPTKQQRITTYKTEYIYGSDEKIKFIEFDYGVSCGAQYPGKVQLVVSNSGKYIGKFFAVRTKLEQINKNENPYLISLETTQHGNGGHSVYRINHDSLENVLDGFSDYFLRTYDSDEDELINEPFELPHKFLDVNHDKKNDIMFYGKILRYGKKYPVKFYFVYNKGNGHFIEEKDYCKIYHYLIENN